MLKDPPIKRSAAFIKYDESKWGIIIVGPGNDKLIEQRKRVCEIFKCKTSNQDCKKCLKTLKESLYKMFKREVDNVICLNEHGQETKTRTSFENCHFYSLVVTDRYAQSKKVSNNMFKISI